MKHFHACTLLIMCLLSLGCTTTLTERELKEQFDHARGDTLGRAVYLGRKNNYDYFRIDWNLGSTRYRIPVPNRFIDHPQPLGSDPRIYPLRGTPTFDGPLPPQAWTPTFPFTDSP